MKLEVDKNDESLAETIVFFDAFVEENEEKFENGHVGITKGTEDVSNAMLKWVAASEVFSHQSNGELVGQQVNWREIHLQDSKERKKKMRNGRDDSINFVVSG